MSPSTHTVVSLTHNTVSYIKFRTNFSVISTTANPQRLRTTLDKFDNMRLFGARFKKQRFNFAARWISGKKNDDANALSHTPSNRPQATDELVEGPTRFSMGKHSSMLSKDLKRPRQTQCWKRSQQWRQRTL